MNEMYNLVSKLLHRDTILIYLFLWKMAGEVAGKLADRLSFDYLAFLMGRQGLTTGRGKPFTAAVLRNRFRELEQSGIVDKEDGSDGLFTLTLFAPFPAPPPPKPTPPRAYPLFDYFQIQIENENENENGNEIGNEIGNGKENGRDVTSKPVKSGTGVISEPAAPARIKPPEFAQINNIIKQLNKKTKDCFKRTERTGTESVGTGKTGTGKTVGDLVDSVDFADGRVRSLRERIVRLVWEHSVRPDLIDRMTAAAVLNLPGLTLPDIESLNREAEDEQAIREKTNGFRGRKTKWETITLHVKNCLESAGYRWVPCRPGYEPSPHRARARQNRPGIGKNCSEVPNSSTETTAPPVDLTGFGPEDLTISFTDLVRKVQSLRHYPPSAAQAAALAIRQRLRELEPCPV